jgi:hypothetical protein
MGVAKHLPGKYLNSIIQGSVIIMFSILMFNDSYANIVTITFSSLILIEILNVYTQVSILVTGTIR